MEKRITSWFSAGLIWKIEEKVVNIFTNQKKEKLLFLVVKYYYQGKESLRFPGGTFKPECGDKNVMDTLRREILEETGLSIPNNENDFSLILKKEFPCEKFGGGLHLKNWYLIPYEKCKGKIFDSNMFRINPIDNETSPPIWESLHYLVGCPTSIANLNDILDWAKKGLLTSPRIFNTHLQALIKACETLVNMGIKI